MSSNHCYKFEQDSQLPGCNAALESSLHQTSHCHVWLGITQCQQYKQNYPSVSMAVSLQWFSVCGLENPTFIYNTAFLVLTTRCQLTDSFWKNSRPLILCKWENIFHLSCMKTEMSLSSVRGKRRKRSRSSSARHVNTLVFRLSHGPSWRLVSKTNPGSKILCWICKFLFLKAIVIIPLDQCLAIECMIS